MNNLSSAEETFLKAVKRYKWRMLPVLIYAVSFITLTILTVENQKFYKEHSGGHKKQLVIWIYINYVTVNSFSLYSIMWMFMEHMQSAY